ncbi:MAG TPA: hypothetical protein EYP59_01745 [Thiotrichaceae bacterium]|nr:hypothetical protein [Thiotrichaceae bacterium]
MARGNKIHDFRKLTEAEYEQKLVAKVLSYPSHNKGEIDHLAVAIDLFNYTLSDGDEETLRIGGDVLWDRSNHKIGFSFLSVEKGLEYCEDLITHYQIDKSMGYFPFEEAALKTLLNSLQTHCLTPYEINKKCSGMLLNSLANKVNKITEDKVVKWLKA